MFLHVVGHNQRFRVIHSTFRRSIETISRYFQQVLYAIGEIRGKMINPISLNTPPKIENSYRWFPYFRDCIGAIDGTYVTAKVPRSMSATFRGRKHYTCQNVLTVVAHDGYGCRPGILPPSRKTRYHLNEFSAKHQPLNARELFNLRHSSLRITIERAFAALKNRFKVLDQKPFHTFGTQVKLVLVCCILHN
ncbi:uncharacterized protein [Lolium perenne]|uniref:uncharacterized protein n=1 Tax=Lolium perenne TaxID=4522 RepID=UPI003A9A389E